MSRYFSLSVAVAVALMVSMVGCKSLKVAGARPGTDGSDGGINGGGKVVKMDGTPEGDFTPIDPTPIPTTPFNDGDPNGRSKSIDEALDGIDDKFIQKRDHGFGIVYFAFNQSFIGDQERPKCNAVGDHLVKNPTYSVLLEGHCDERGSEEYNRGLGERRALAVKDYLVNLGVDAGRIRTLSFGEEKPADPGRTEAAFTQNRRAEFVILLPKP